VQGNINLKKCKNKLEEFNEDQIDCESKKKHLINSRNTRSKNLKECTSSNRRLDNCGGLLPLCLSTNVMAPQR
jgi:hypothetical protein